MEIMKKMQEGKTDDSTKTLDRILFVDEKFGKKDH